jgi:hypothetical protein
MTEQISLPTYLYLKHLKTIIKIFGYDRILIWCMKVIRKVYKLGILTEDMDDFTLENSILDIARGIKRDEEWTRAHSIKSPENHDIQPIN